jgi:uncharacterized membrane protein
MKAILLAVLAGLCWGVRELCRKSVLHTHKIGPLTAIAARSTVAPPLLWLVYFVATRGVDAEPHDWWGALAAADRAKLILGSGLVAGAAAMVFFYAALNLADISTVKPIAFTLAPATAVVLGWLVLGESMSLRKAIAVLMILAGVVLLTGGAVREAPAAAASAEAVTGR